MKYGFTLIEMLVVVLIVGILAAVALPQYETAVEKSRATQAFILGKHLAEAEELHYLSAGRYTDDWDELGETRPNIKGWNFSLDFTVENIVASREGTTLHYRFFMREPHVFSPYAGKYLCVAQESDEKAMSVCRSLGTSEIPEDYTHMSGNYKAFGLN
ncbi:MAG: prepilin-type N-terminal cleavage/methylation domain-containing protein [Elusimicrobiales bacterium]|uniref:type IV pilin protein n=1 Tax=Candidatus Avelusimicrobium sp. TaxID=3048833 RepID=UPI002704267B|nr:prepilin-type N-terminal cleavage/methylation domain-containing protein [Elusimicrobiales bacterium]